jgi:beta-lactam-binding protein with PASTA domain
VRVPDVSGETEQQAIDALAQAGLRPSGECCIQSSLPKGRVVYTEPSAGEQIASGTRVTYMLSEGSGWPTWLLILVGLASAAAVAALAWLAIPKRPRISVRLPLDPTATVVWGDPISPDIETAIPAITSTVEFPPYKERDK